jgi:hypothetical protein
MCCEHNWIINWYRVTWSGRFTLLSELCKNCNQVRERSIENNPPKKSTYPSTKWIKI